MKRCTLAVMSTVRELRIEQYVEYPLIKIEGMNLRFLLENSTYLIILFLKYFRNTIAIIWIKILEQFTAMTFNFVVRHQSTLLMLYVK